MSNTARWLQGALAAGLLVIGCKGAPTPPAEPQHADPTAALVTPVAAADDRDPRELVDLAVTRKGGAELLLSIRTVRTEAVLDGVDARISLWYPDRHRVDWLKEGQIIRSLVWNGDRMELRESDGRRLPLSETDGELVARSVKGSVIPVLRAAMTAESRLSRGGRAEVEGRAVHVVDVETPDGFRASLYIAADTYDILAVRYETSRGPVMSVESDFRETGGLRVAHRSRVVIGSEVHEGRVKSVALNPTLDEADFEPKPPPAP